MVLLICYASRSLICFSLSPPPELHHVVRRRCPRCIGPNVRPPWRCFGACSRFVYSPCRPVRAAQRAHCWHSPPFDGSELIGACRPISCPNNVFRCGLVDPHDENPDQQNFFKRLKRGFVFTLVIVDIADVILDYEVNKQRILFTAIAGGVV